MMTPWPDEVDRDEKGRPLFCIGPDCTNRLTQPKAGRPRRFCSPQCRQRYGYWRVRDPHVSQSAGWEAMKAEAPARSCAICEGPLPTRRHRVTCGSRDCRRALNTIWSVDGRKQPKQPEASR